MLTDSMRNDRERVRLGLSQAPIDEFTTALRQTPREEWVSLVRHDQADRWQSGQCVAIEEYLRRCPELATHEEDTLVLIVGEMLHRRKLGQEVHLKEYQERFPQLANPLRLQFELDRLWTETDADAVRSIVCPVCRNAIEHVDTTSATAACSVCGSSFLLTRETQSSSTLAEHRVLGKYELLELVGVGTFGTVYKARDTELGRVVAVKVPRAAAPWESDDPERFEREARSVASLQHPSIVAIYEIGGMDQNPYLVTEYVHGVTLAELMSSRRPTPREAAHWLSEVADALHYAHEMGVIHRDVKPANIMLDEKGRPRLMDFGLAKRHDAGEVTMTLDGQVIGTPAYMSPEQREASPIRSTVAATSTVWVSSCISC